MLLLLSSSAWPGTTWHKAHTASNSRLNASFSSHFFTKKVCRFCAPSHPFHESSLSLLPFRKTRRFLLLLLLPILNFLFLDPLSCISSIPLIEEERKGRRFWLPVSVVLYPNLPKFLFLSEFSIYFKSFPFYSLILGRREGREPKKSFAGTFAFSSIGEGGGHLRQAALEGGGPCGLKVKHSTAGGGGEKPFRPRAKFRTLLGFLSSFLCKRPVGLKLVAGLQCLLVVPRSTERPSPPPLSWK